MTNLSLSPPQSALFFLASFLAKAPLLLDILLLFCEMHLGPTSCNIVVVVVDCCCCCCCCGCGYCGCGCCGCCGCCCGCCGCCGCSVVAVVAVVVVALWLLQLWLLPLLQWFCCSCCSPPHIPSSEPAHFGCLLKRDPNHCANAFIFGPTCTHRAPVGPKNDALGPERRR